MTSRPWWATAIVYQLYVRSFADADGDGIGDLQGIRQRLDHLAGLGIDAIWLNPCYPSPQHDHGYDVADYFSIEPDYGTLEEFDALVAAARDRGIRILMDVVPNHCSWLHPWFTEAVAAGPGSPQRERFWFREGRGPGGELPPNNWQAIFGGPAWHRVTEPDGSPGQWYLAVFTPYQPDFNWDHPDVVDHFDRMLCFWFDRGVEGFRADAVTVVGKTPGLPDTDAPEHHDDGLDGSRLGGPNPHYTWRPEGHEVWRHWRRTVDEYEHNHPGRQLVTVAEAYTPHRPDLMRQYLNPAEFHQVFAFDLLLAPWNAASFRYAVTAAIDVVADQGLLPTWTLNNHDAHRSVTRYGRADAETHGSHHESNLQPSHALVDLELGLRRARAAAVLMLGLPGCIYLYAGEELGLPEVLDLPDEARQDPVFALTDGHDLGRDGCRVPLPWTADPSSSFGFSPAHPAAPPWLPQPADWGRYSAAAQAHDPTSTLSLYRLAVATRRSSPSLLGDAFSWLLDDDEDLVAFARRDVLVVLNLGSRDRALPDELAAGRRVLLASDGCHTDPTVVPADTALWLGASI